MRRCGVDLVGLQSFVFPPKVKVLLFMIVVVFYCRWTQPHNVLLKKQNMKCAVNDLYDQFGRRARRENYHTPQSIYRAA